MKNKKILCVLIVCLLAMGLTACSESKPVNKVELLSDEYVIEHYTIDFPQYNSIASEMYYVAWEGGLFIPTGPTEPGYRVIIELKDGECTNLLSEYEWTLVDNPELNVELIDVPESADWYECEQFNQDKFQYVNVNYAFFDGVDTIIFDVHTY
ncbi:MAG: hypothetical protein ACI4DU_05255 [Lachnospiraceae bacterium]